MAGGRRPAGVGAAAPVAHRQQPGTAPHGAAGGGARNWILPLQEAREANRAAGWDELLPGTCTSGCSTRAPPADMECCRQPNQLIDLLARNAPDRRSPDYGILCSTAWKGGCGQKEQRWSAADGGASDASRRAGWLAACLAAVPSDTHHMWDICGTPRTNSQSAESIGRGSVSVLHAAAAGLERWLGCQPGCRQAQHRRHAAGGSGWAGSSRVCPRSRGRPWLLGEGRGQTCCVARRTRPRRSSLNGQQEVRSHTQCRAASAELARVQVQAPSGATA